METMELFNLIPQADHHCSRLIGEFGVNFCIWFTRNCKNKEYYELITCESFCEKYKIPIYVDMEHINSVELGDMAKRGYANMYRAAICCDVAEWR